MRLYQNTQLPQKMGVRNKREPITQCRVCGSDRTQISRTNRPLRVTESQQQEEGDLCDPQKLLSPVLASLQQRALHQELLFCHRRGVLPRSKTELQRVLENKTRERTRKREQALQAPSDLEVKLRRRRQRLQLYELEEKKWKEALQNVPEFVCVRRALKHVAMPS